MKSLLLAVALLVAPAAAVATNSVEAFDRLVVDFENEWGPFFRNHFGCPAEATKYEQCKPSLGGLDRKTFDRAGKIARKLWPE